MNHRDVLIAEKQENNKTTIIEVSEDNNYPVGKYPNRVSFLYSSPNEILCGIIILLLYNCIVKWGLNL